jgi:DNA repair protein RadC
LHCSGIRSCTISLLQPVETFASPIERLRRTGVDSLSAEELVALVLQAGQRGQSGLGTARRLVRDFGSISRLARAGAEELTTLSGLTPEQAAALTSSFRLAGLAESESRPPRLASAADVAAIAKRELENAARERVIVLVCDAANQLRVVVKISEGSVDRAFLPVREILSAVLRHDGRAFAVAHNHPSGDLTPGSDDVQATDRLRAAAGTVGVRFLDHVIVAGKEWRPIKMSRRTLG